MPNDVSRAASPASSPAAFLYAFAAPPGSTQPIIVRSEYDIEPHLRQFLLGWPCRRLTGNAASADILLRRAGQRAAVSLASGYGEELDAMSEFDGVNCLADLLAHVAADRMGGLAELHTSAALVGEKLVLFVGPSLSGKSSLALQMATHGCRLFADDRLLVGPLDGSGGLPYGMALGLTPRVRHPPHPAAGPVFAEFVARHLVKAGGNVGFLPLSGEMTAGFGETAALGAIVLPERRDGGGVSLRPAGAAAASRVLLEQLRAPQVSAADLLAAVRGLTGALPCWHLEYDDSARAALAIKDMVAGRK